MTAHAQIAENTMILQRNGDGETSQILGCTNVVTVGSGWLLL